jgi:hypothetical protein
METRDKDFEKKKKEQHTPIIDGDARPDMNINPEDNKDHPIETPTDKKLKTTKNRNDSNSIEDYKDAVQ